MKYEKLALITKSDQFHGNLVPKLDALQLIDTAIAVINALDVLKKSFFYGRAYPHLGPVGESCNSIASGWVVKVPSNQYEDIKEEYQSFSESKAIDVIHALLGKATEAGEGLELLFKTIKTKTFDDVNAIEETFDGQWYDAILCEAVGIDFEEGQARNIAKLKKRFGDKFTAYFANNRDFIGERKVLETTTKVDGLMFHDSSKMAANLIETPASLMTPSELKEARSIKFESPTGFKSEHLKTITKAQLESAINCMSIDAKLNIADYTLAEQLMTNAERFTEHGSPVGL